MSFPFRPYYFLDRYYQFYVPSLQRFGYMPLRAWGGLFGEDYSKLLMDVIATSQVLFADLTLANANVAYEVGLAHGLGKDVFLVVEGDSAVSPSNLGGFPMATYLVEGDGWQDEAISQASFIIAVTQRHARPWSSEHRSQKAAARVCSRTFRWTTRQSSLFPLPRLSSWVITPVAREARHIGRRFAYPTLEGHRSRPDHGLGASNAQFLGAESSPFWLYFGVQNAPARSPSGA